MVGEEPRRLQWEARKTVKRLRGKEKLRRQGGDFRVDIVFLKVSDNPYGRKACGEILKGRQEDGQF